ncbi:MAG: hypothetical protein IKI30_07395 [Oxalobacter sp.]|nr:hypothetical protein [Oxalobacter sp.]
MKLKSTIAIAAFSALSFGLCSTAAHAFDLGGVINAVTQPKTNKTGSPVGGGLSQGITVTIKSAPYAHIFISDTKLAPTGDVRSDDGYRKYGMTNDKGVYSDRIPANTKSIVVYKYINKTNKSKTIQYTGQTNIDAKL